MPAMLSRLYHALLGAGVDDATATAAAEEAAQGDTRLATIEMKVTQLQGDIETRFARIEGLMETRFARVDGDIGRTLDAVKALSDRMESHIRITYWILGILAAALVGLAWRLLK